MEIPEINDRILQLVEKKANKSRNEFAKKIGVAQQSINRLFNIDKRTGKYPLATTEIIASITEMFVDIDANWLLTGKGSMLKEDPKASKVDILGDKPEQMSVYKLRTDYYGVEKQNIPLFEIDARAGLDVLFSSQSTQVPIDFITVPNAPKCDGALFVRGDSMYPILKAGDIVCYKAINNIDNLILGEMYILDIDNGEEEYLTVKFVKKCDKGDKFVTLVSENKHHADRDILRESIRALGLVKLSIRYNTIS